ncbi:CHAP domain-containing protein, partial [Clostridioides difficile]|nr:CHAP domain-containing protein [Clostridioides difficile]
MGKKLKKDFKERQRARIEKETLQSNMGIEPEESKLKYNDDYRGKIVHDKDRFQDKVHEKTSKIISDSEHVRGISK